MIDINENAKFVKGVGPNRAELLNRLGIYTLKDLITYYPREHEDRSNFTKIIDLIDGQEATIKGIAVSRINEIRTRKRNMTIYRLMVRDDTGTILITWYNQSYLKTMFKMGETYSFFGKVNIKDGVYQMMSPTYDKEGNNKNTGKIIPIYPLTYQLSQNNLRQIIENGLQLIQGEIKETIPQYLIDEYKLESISKAINSIHFPKDFQEFEKARKRLVFEELLSMQLALLSLKNQYAVSNTGITFDKNVKISDVIDKLPFKLTRAQLKVLEEIDSDMENDKAMNRLLQGDVGSRKNSSSNYSSI